MEEPIIEGNLRLEKEKYINDDDDEEKEEEKEEEEEEEKSTTVIRIDGVVEKIFIRKALQIMRKRNELSIELCGMLKRVFFKKGASLFSYSDWTGIEMMINPYQGVSSFLDTFFLADKSSNYYGNSRRRVMRILREKNKTITDGLINIHSLSGSGVSSHYCVSFGVKVNQNTHYCIILTTLPALSQGGKEELGVNAEQIVNNMDLLSQLVACYGKGTFTINSVVKRVHIHNENDDNLSECTNTQLCLALYNAFMFQLLGIDRLELDYTPKNFISKLGKVIKGTESIESLVSIEGEGDILKNVGDIDTFYTTIEDYDYTVPFIEMPVSENPATNGFSLDKMRVLTNIRLGLLESKAKDVATNEILTNDFLYPGFIKREEDGKEDEFGTTNTQIKWSDDDDDDVVESGKRKRKRRIGEITTCAKINQKRDELKKDMSKVQNILDKERVKFFQSKLGVDLLILDEKEIQKSGTIVDSTQHRAILAAANTLSSPMEDLEATDMVDKYLDEWYMESYNEIEELAKKHESLCKPDVVKLMSGVSVGEGEFGQILQIRIKGKQFVYKVLSNTNDTDTIEIEADKYTKAMQAHAKRKEAATKAGTVGTMLCPSLRMLRMFKCLGKNIALIAEPLDRTLHSFMVKESPELLSTTYISIFKQCLNGLSFLRNEFEFTHNDIKTDNVMLRWIGSDRRLDYRAEDLDFNGDMVVISMIGYQAIFIDFGYASMYDYPTQGVVNSDHDAGQLARKMSSFVENASGTMKMADKEIPMPPDAYFRGYRPFQLENPNGDLNNLILMPVKENLNNYQKLIKWKPKKTFEHTVSNESYLTVKYIDIDGKLTKLSSSPYFEPKESSNLNKGPGSKMNPPLSYFNDTMDLIAMFCKSTNRKTVHEKLVMDYSGSWDSPWFHPLNSKVEGEIGIFAQILETIWKPESMLDMEYNAVRDAKLFYLPLLYRYIFYR